jgi:hypothetical protein
VVEVLDCPTVLEELNTVDIVDFAVELEVDEVGELNAADSVDFVTDIWLVLDELDKLEIVDELLDAF